MTSLATSASAHTGPLPRWWSGPAYGLLGLPLAFVALPLYVVLPHHYAPPWACRWPAWGPC